MGLLNFKAINLNVICLSMVLIEKNDYNYYKSKFILIISEKIT